jgi:uncharacterized surface protein with fasciclin (FAS1) repeats
MEQRTTTIMIHLFNTPVHVRVALAGAVLAAAVLAGSAPASAQNGLGAIAGAAFIDSNGNGQRDAGESAALGRYKITDGGNFWRCGNTGSDNTYSVPVSPGTYYIFPVAGPNQYSSAPVIKVQVSAGQRVVADLPLASLEGAAAENCGAYVPRRTARVPLGIPETATGVGFVTLATLVNTAGLFDTLSGRGPFTVFAPNEAAFAKLTDVQKSFIVGDRNLLRSVLTYHVVRGKLTAQDVAKAKTLTTVNGAELPVEVKDGKVFVGGAEVLATDVPAANGIVHVIDSVLVP